MPTLELLQEEKNVEVILVDNGSDSIPSQLQRELGSRTSILLNKNLGSSVARNLGIEAARGKDIFLIDGDIQYVPGTIDFYSEIKRSQVAIGCVGYHNMQQVATTGTNGVLSLDQADTKVEDGKYGVSAWFPMAWTQYGLFDGDMLREVKFPVQGAFGEPGHGYEDDWLYHEMRRLGYRSLSVDAPVYYHDAHKGLIQLGDQAKTNQRAAIFHMHWGFTGWRETVQRISLEEQRPVIYHSYESQYHHDMT